MRNRFARWSPAVLLGALCASPAAAQEPTTIEVQGTTNVALDGQLVASTTGEIRGLRLLPLDSTLARVVLWEETGGGSTRARFAISLDGRTWSPAQDVEGELQLRHGAFDPTTGVPPVAPGLQQGPAEQLFLVQFETQGLEIYREGLRRLGATVHQYLPHQAHVVRMDAKLAEVVAELPYVRWVGAYHAAYRLQPELHDLLAAANFAFGTAEYNLVLIEKSDRSRLMGKIADLGGEVTDPQDGSIFVQAALSPAQLLVAAHLDEVLWIDEATPIEVDVDNARIQGGANYIESVAGYVGDPQVRGEIYEGIYNTHPEYNSVPGLAPIIHNCGTADSHGNATFGIVFSQGVNPQARGIVPGGRGIYGNYSCTGVSRYTHVGQLVDPNGNYRGLHQTASWGNARNTVYDSVSADMDDIIMDHDITITQSQSNSGGTPSRPQAWAKNVISVGGFRHGDNANPADDCWCNTGSTGPAQDGRIKPDISAYYDSIYTTSGSSSYQTGFGGTSGATPIVAGHMLLIHQMWTDGIFGNTLPVPGGTRIQNKGHFSTMKAMLLASAYLYPISQGTRTQLGYGMPDLRYLYDHRNNMLVVDEEDVLTNLQTKSYSLNVAAGTPEIKIVMAYVDKEGTTSASQHRINNVDLKVTSPGGTIYHGNNGTATGSWSVAGGTPDTKNTVETVFVQNPQAGAWTIEITAAQLNVDTHLETPGVVDQDFGLVAIGGTGAPPCSGSTAFSGVGCKDLQGIFGFTLAMEASGEPCVGKRLTVGVYSSPINVAPQILVFGTSTTNWGALPLPFDMGALGATGCSIYTEHGITLPLPAVSGGNDVSFDIPEDPSMVGATLHAQNYFVQPLANTLGIASSDLLSITIGQ